MVLRRYTGRFLKQLKSILNSKWKLIYQVLCDAGKWTVGLIILNISDKLVG